MPIFIVFGLTWMVLEYTIYCTQGERDDHYTWMVLEYTIYCTQGEHDDHYT